MAELLPRDDMQSRVSTLARDLAEWLKVWQSRGLAALPVMESSSGVDGKVPLPEPVVTMLVEPPPMKKPIPDGAGTSAVMLESSGTRAERLKAFYQAVGPCQRCSLCQDRKNIVFGSGNPDSKVLLVGEGPGSQEDLEGLPFVGPSGQLLTQMLQAVGINRSTDIYITNIVKCRPPKNRDPEEREVASCRFILQAQITVINPEVVLVVGSQAAKALLGTTGSLGSMRGRIHSHGSSSAIVTYHPSFLLRSPRMRQAAWVDMVALRRHLISKGLAPGIPAPWWRE